MQDFNHDYFLLLKPNDERLPSADPNADTINRSYRKNQIPAGSSPLIFYDGFLELKREQKIKPYDSPPDVLFDGSNPVVKTDIADALWKLDIANLAMNDSIYIDHNDNWHENLWFLGFTKKFDCWDREKSEYRENDEDDDEDEPVTVWRYSLNHALLDQTPMRERLLFKMGGTDDGFITAHASVARYFAGKTGVVVVPLVEYGDPNKPRTYI
jgi:hypothetical protein